MCPDCQARIAALEAFCLQLAEHLYLAYEILAIRAERKT